jgi:hypothetical protein
MDVGGGDPTAAVPFERLSGGPGGEGKRRARWGRTAARVPTAAAAGGGGAAPRPPNDKTERLLRASENGDEAGEAAAVAAAARPPPAAAPARLLKSLLRERLQQVRDAIGDAAKRRSAEAATTTTTTTTTATTATTTLASAVRLGGRELLPERVAALLSRAERVRGAPPLAFVCPLTNEVMADPVVAPDGYSYERAALASLLAAADASRTPPLSPMTREPLLARGRAAGVPLVPNRVLAAAILEWGERAGRQPPSGPPPEAAVPSTAAARGGGGNGGSAHH